MKLEESDHWMTQMTDMMVNTSSKLNQGADLNLVLGQKLDRLAGLSADSEQKIGRLSDKIDQLADLSTKTEQKIGRLSDKVDKLADVSGSTNQKLDRLVEALLRREGLATSGRDCAEPLP
ncbi:MAG TPA: hypothetical protein VFZ27_03755 [Terriglobia bacterium]|nr:hypothetical protein [Terriglobia bacterium]